jgi:phage gp46-like protein
MDAALVWKENEFDLEIKNQDIVRDDGIRTAVIISLFTDKRVSSEEVTSEDPDQRGWWGDMFPEVDQDQIGSRLWLLQRAKQTNETLSRAKEYAEESLQWMIEDGVAASVTVVVEYLQRGWMKISVDVKRPRSTLSFRYEFNWQFEAARE